jgi:hypothetical protein
MNEDIRLYLKESSLEFRLPRYKELPNVGLYLEQVAKYINGFLVSVNCAEITTSMISNYVKKGCIPSPQKKQYYPEQIAYLIFIAVAKNVLSLENIIELFEMQKNIMPLQKAYDYFCEQLEQNIFCVFGHSNKVDTTLESNSSEKLFLKNIVISVSHSIYLNFYFNEIKKKKENELQLQHEAEKENKEHNHNKKDKKKHSEKQSENKE